MRRADAWSWPVYGVLCGLVVGLTLAPPNRAIHADLRCGTTAASPHEMSAVQGGPGIRPEAEGAVATASGHSYHGEAFNEGPRQRGRLIDGTGEITFPCTTENELARRFVLQGVGQLHGFWYFEAERSFRQAAALDPDCAIAHWGMAMANVNNENRARAFIAEARRRRSSASRHEGLYIDAWAQYLSGNRSRRERAQAYVKALERICYEYPDDLEARAFLGLQLWKNRQSGIPLSSYLAVDALFGQVLESNPLHPCHHYVIHLWEYERPQRALGSALKCGPAAPAIAHMWHMPAHTYSRLKRYEEAVWHQEAAARVDHAYMIRTGVLPDRIHNFAHNNEWLVRNLIRVGRARDAVSLAKNMIELPRHPRLNTLTRRSAFYGRMRLFQALSDFELWDEMIRLANSVYLEATDLEREQVARLRHLGRASFRRGDVERGRACLEQLEARLERITSECDSAASEADQRARAAARRRTPQLAGQSEAEWLHFVEQRSASEGEEARSAAVKPFLARLRPLRQAIDELNGHVAVAESRHQDAHALFKQAGGIDPAYLARVQFLAGEHDAAEKALASHARSRRNETLPLARLVELRWQLDRRDEARTAFEELRTISGSIDLSAPPFARLAPIAAELGFAEDWRVAKPRSDDFGERPELASLGPFRWEPSPAECWRLRDAAGGEHALADYRGRPVVVIFYLGHGCPHCVQQLQTFAPKAAEFAEAGLSLIAISTDDESSLSKSLDEFQDGTFPFPLVSDASLDVFKKYRAFDDFESQPLHGTFLIDGEGLVRWHDVSYEPFMDAEFLLGEAQRLLAISGWRGGKRNQRPMY